MMLNMTIVLQLTYASRSEASFLTNYIFYSGVFLLIAVLRHLVAPF